MSSIEGFKLKQMSLEKEIVTLNNKKIEMEKNLSEEFISYEYNELLEDVQRFENSNEIKHGKSSRMKEKFERMKEVLAFKNLEKEIKQKESEKEESIKYIKGTNITLKHLHNYYKNIKIKSNNNMYI